MIKKLAIFISLFFVFSSLIKAQNTDSTNAILNAVKKSMPNVGMEINAKQISSKNTFTIQTKKPIKKSSLSGTGIYGDELNKWSVGIASGITQFFGDIKEWDLYPSSYGNFKELKSAMSLQLNRTSNNIYGFQAEFISGKFAGLRTSYTQNPFHTQYDTIGEKFIAEFIEFDFNTLINLSNLFVSGKKTKYLEINRRVTCFAKIGIGINFFRTIRRTLDSDKFLNSYGYEWTWQNDFENAGTVKENWLDTPHETTLILGLNAKYRINKRIDIDAGITSRRGHTDKWDAAVEQHRSTVGNDTYIFYSVGMTYKLGNKVESLEWYSPLDEMYNSIGNLHANIEGLSADTDNDGVSNSFDKYPNTPFGVAVDGAGKPLDVDMDNVPDYMDEDPFSTRGAIVDENGKELDADEDGIPDSKDLEMNTERGSLVNRFGISMQSKNGKDAISAVFFPSVYFISNSNVVDASNFSRIAIVAKVLLSNPDLRLMVIGNTDKEGTEAYNLKLGRERAQEVVQHFEAVYGITSERFKVETKGESSPLAIGTEKNLVTDNIQLQDEYDQINRRVDFEIVD